MKLKWINKQKYITKKDVSLNFCKNKNRAYTSIILRNGLKNMVAPSGYITVAIGGEKLYFQQATQELGYKLSNKGQTGTVNTQIYNDSLTRFTETHSGDYNLQYDVKNKLYYIDTEV